MYLFPVETTIRKQKTTPPLEFQKSIQNDLSMMKTHVCSWSFCRKAKTKVDTSVWEISKLCPETSTKLYLMNSISVLMCRIDRNRISKTPMWGLLCIYIALPSFSKSTVARHKIIVNRCLCFRSESVNSAPQGSVIICTDPEPHINKQKFQKHLDFYTFLSDANVVISER
jgi:hypothetical protein